MSDYFGKAVFKDGTEAFLVYRTSPGWTLQPLFSSLDAAVKWKQAGCPELEREQDQAFARSKTSEEPVHVLINVDYPDKPSLWFYTTASKSGMVITGPKSALQAEEANESAGGIYSKEFFDAWATESPAEKRPSARSISKQDDGFQP